MKVPNTVLWTVQALVTPWDYSDHPGDTQNKRLLSRPRDEIMLHNFIAGVKCPSKRETEEHRSVSNPGSMGMVPTEIFNEVPHLTWHVLFGQLS